MFTVPPNHKFACLALSRASIDRSLKDALDLGGGCWATFGAPIALDSVWKEWLGSIRSEHLSTCTLNLWAIVESRSPSILDDENQTLIERASHFFYALLLGKIFHYDTGLLMSGAQVNGRLSIRSVSNLETHYRPAGAIAEIVAREDLLDARKTVDGIRAIHIAGTEPPRLARGLHAWIGGLREFYGANRLHQFVRAVEAIVKPAAGESRAKFAHRGQLFAGSSPSSHKLLSHLYELRNHTEHMNPLDSGLTEYPAADRFAVGLERAFQAQMLASQIYLRILESPDLVSLFSSDDQLDSFWAKPWADQVAAWGHPIDIASITETGFQKDLLPLHGIAVIPRNS